MKFFGKLTLRKAMAFLLIRARGNGSHKVCANIKRISVKFEYKIVIKACIFRRNQERMHNAVLVSSNKLF